MTQSAKLQPTIKQLNKQTFIDLSKQDLFIDDFVAQFEDFTEDNSSFLSGNALSLILPDQFETEEAETKLEAVIEEIKTVLNKKNISLKKVSRGVSNESLKAQVTKKETKNESKPAAKIEEAVSPDHSDDESSLGVETLYIRSNLRAGQQVVFRGNVVVYGDVNDSAEIIASGDVLIWGKLRGVVHAGAEGDNDAVITSLKFGSAQLRISDKFVSLVQKDAKGKDRKNIVPGVLPQIAKIVDNEVHIQEI